MPTDTRPRRVIEIELGCPLSPVAAVDPCTGRRYDRALALVRLHGQPLGLIEIPLDGDGATGDDCAEAIWRALRETILAHLRQDGLPVPDRLTHEGLVAESAPLCRVNHERFLASAPLASIILCTRDRPELLTACLPSLLAQDYPRFEVIVVDNAPRTSATRELVQSRFGHLPRVRYVCEETPGLSRARNRGLAEARGEVVAFTDDDARADREWLGHLVEGFHLAENVACVTGALLPAELDTEAQVIYQDFAGYSKGRAFSALIFNSTTHRQPHPLFPYLAAHFGSGGNMAYNAAALRQIGCFDEALGTGTIARGGEDIDAFFRIITAGFTLMYQPAAFVWHFDKKNYADMRQMLNGYGVAFTAFMTKSLLDRPARALYLLSRAPSAVRYLIDPKSARNASKSRSYPHDLTRAELLGMLQGPIAYLRSRRCTRASAQSRPATSSR